MQAIDNNNIKALATKCCRTPLLAILIFIVTCGGSYASDSLTNKAHTGDAAKSYYPKYPPVTIKPGVDAELVKQGEYLVKIGDCISCHTNVPAGGKPFAGGLPLRTPFGTFYAPNITPDKETGIGNWTFNGFYRAMHDGVRPNGSNYFPVFPYTSFTKVSKTDLRAIKAYLDSIPPVFQLDKKTTASWPFSWRYLQTFWKWMFFDKNTYKYDPEKSALWNRGAYLVQGLGHCGECHTPRNAMGAMKQKYYLTGAFIEGYWAPDITGIEFSDTPVVEIGDVFDQAQLINKAGPVRGPMQEVDHNSLMEISQSDLNAIALYLKSVETPQPRLPKGVPGKTDYSLGRKVYHTVCAMCHDKGVAGAPMIYDTANWELRLKQGPDILMKHAIDGWNNMPPKGGCVTCTDEDVKSAVVYILDNSQNIGERKFVAAQRSKKPDTSVALGKVIYQRACAICHDDGKLGAPRLGDKEIWKPLINKGIETLIVNTISGIHNMPAKGGCKQCSNAEIIAAVKYMLQEADPDGDYSLW